MRTITISIAMLLGSLCVQLAYAQENEAIQILEKSRTEIINEEKDALKKEVETINDRQSKGEISEVEAENLKQDQQLDTP